jgi:hypothetical protein
MKKNSLLIGGGVTVLVIFLVFLLIRAGGVSLPGTKNLSDEKIKVSDERGELTVFRNGDVLFVGADGQNIYDKWDADKTDAFFNHYFDNFVNAGVDQGSGENTITISTVDGDYTYNGDDDELGDAVIDDETGGEDDSGGGGDDIGDYFGSPTPRPSSTPYGSPTPTPYSPFKDCLYWKLSYCVIPKVTPTPEPTAAPGEGVIEAANCDEWNETQSSNTVINNTVCIPSQ